MISYYGLVEKRAGAGKKGQVKGMPKCTPTYMIVNLHAFRRLSNGLYWQLGSLRRKIKGRYGVVMGVVMEALFLQVTRITYSSFILVLDLAT